MSNMNSLTGMSLTAESMPCFLLRWVTVWKGRRVPVSGSTATHSPSMMASFPFRAEDRCSAMSGKFPVRFSSLLE